MTETRSADPRYLLGWPASCARRSSTAVTRSDPNCRPNMNCANGFRSAGIPCGRARRLREDHLIESRPRPEPMVVPRTKTGSTPVQDVMSIDDLMAFATGALPVIHANKMLTCRRRAARAHGLPIGGGVAGGRRIPSGRRRAEPHLFHRVPHQPGVRLGRLNSAAEQRPHLPVDRGHVRPHHRRGAPGDRRGADARGPGRPPRRRAGHGRAEVRRTYTTSDGEIAQVTINTHPGNRYRHPMTMRRVKG